jgi:hypothetical protein
MFRIFLLAALTFAASQAHAAAPAFPLKAAENGRFLVDQKGRPFLVTGDSPWSLIVQPREEEIDHYLDDRARRGFNAVLVNLIEHKFCSHPPRTRAGLAPFKKAGDFSTPNAAYFDFAYKVVKKANDRGIAVWLCAAYLGYGGGDEGWFREMKAGGKAALHSYGRFVGKRFKDLPNIVWVMGGDFTPDRADRWTVTEVAEGIRAEDSRHLMTGHFAPGTSAVGAFGERAWLTLNTVYSYDKSLFRPLLAEYQRRPVRPFVLLETVYENEHNSTPEEIRRQAYWAMLSGACGQFLGNNPIWHFDGPGLYLVKGTWQQALDGTGSRNMARLNHVFAGLPWHKLVPDQDHAVVKDGYGKDTATALTARTADRRLAITYVPSTGTGSRALTVDLGQFAGPVRARWCNPASGRSRAVGDVLLPNRGPRTLRTPGDNGTKTNDWLLVLGVR